ncbi:MAG: hypothetical protein LJE59_11505 [Chromatiaceae bacterium]|nr:hypothetical protein [Chromatiaceae bacterium]
MNLKIIILGAAFVAMLWYAMRISPDAPATHHAPPDAASTGLGEKPEGHEPWTKEDTAVWRDRVDRRLGR